MSKVFPNSRGMAPAGTRGWSVFIGILCLCQLSAATARTPEDWNGERVVFLDDPLVQQYVSRMYVRDPNGLRDGYSFSDLVGKTATITSVRRMGEHSWRIALTLDGDGRRAYSNYFGGRHLLGVGFLSEAESARAWMGHVFRGRANGPPASGLATRSVYRWRPPHELAWMDEAARESEEVTLPNLAPVTLVDVPGWLHSGLLFKFRLPDSSYVCWVGHASDVNCLDNSDAEVCPYGQFRQYWWDHDPLGSHASWSSADKSAIRQCQLRIGMTPEMVRLSWGDPLDVNRTVTTAGTAEQWIYGTFKPFVYLTDGKVTGWQD